VYKITIDKKTNKEEKKELILDNHSKVMYDYKLIPKDQIRQDA
jgi:vancomycin resistance protein VanW